MSPFPHSTGILYALFRVARTTSPCPRCLSSPISGRLSGVPPVNASPKADLKNKTSKGVQSIAHGSARPFRSLCPPSHPNPSLEKRREERGRSVLLLASACLLACLLNSCLSLSHLQYHRLCQLLLLVLTRIG